MSQVLNVLNLEIGGDPSGSGSSSSGSLASSAPTIVFVQDLVNEMTASVLQAAGSSNVSGLVDDETNSSSSNSNMGSSSPRRPLEKESAKSSKRLKKSAGASGSSLMTTAAGTGSKLEQRLGGILCCAVCLDLPKSSVYQVCFIFILFFIFLP